MVKKYLISLDFPNLEPIELNEEDFDEYGYVSKRFFISEKMKNLVQQYHGEKNREDVKIHSFYNGYEKCYYSNFIKTITSVARFELVLKDE